MPEQKITIIVTNLEALKVAKPATAKEKKHLNKVAGMGCIDALSLGAVVLPCSLTNDKVEG